MTPPMDAAAREADLRVRIRRQIKILRVKSAALGRPSVWDSPKMRDAFEAVAVSGGLGFPPEQLEDPIVTRFDPADPFNADPRPDSPSS